MCDVPSTAVFCNKSIECFPGTASKFFLKLLVTIPVAPIITGIIVHFRFHILCISVPKLLCFNVFSAYFGTIFLPAFIVTSNSVYVFSFILIIISGLFAVLLLLLLILLFRSCELNNDNSTRKTETFMNSSLLSSHSPCSLSFREKPISTRIY